MTGLDQLRPGSLFAEDFRIVRPLSAGGMGAVYVAEQLSTSRPRALKLMHVQIVGDTKLRERFVREAKVGARIASDHIVQVIAAGIDASSGVPWLAMELLEGEDLASHLERRGALPAPECAAIFDQLGHALCAAHRAGVVHRDLKPENIFLAASRLTEVPFTVKILDFGIARVLEESGTALTQAIGSPLWMAPEQTETGGNVTPATDVWALGLIAFRALTGTSYWRGVDRPETSPQMLLRQILIDSLPSASMRAAELGRGHLLPPEFDAWFSRCVRREIPARFPSAIQAMPELTAVLRQTRQRSTVPASLYLAQTALPDAPVRTAIAKSQAMPEPPPRVRTHPNPVSSGRVAKAKRFNGKRVAVGGLTLFAIALVVAGISRSGSSSKGADAKTDKPIKLPTAKSAPSVTPPASASSNPNPVVIPQDTFPSGCSLWEEKRPSSMPGAMILIQMRLCRNGDAITGWERISSPTAGFVDREIDGRVEERGKKLVLRDVKFNAKRVNPGYNYCLTMRYEMDLVEPAHLLGVTVDGPDCQGAANRRDKIELRRALDDKGAMIPITAD